MIRPLILRMDFLLSLDINQYENDCITHGSFSAAQLKTIQEVISLMAFGIFSVVYLKEAFTLKYAVGFSMIGLGAYLIFQK